jgi:hypothetical protein
MLNLRKPQNQQGTQQILNLLKSQGNVPSMNSLKARPAGSAVKNINLYTPWTTGKSIPTTGVHFGGASNIPKFERPNVVSPNIPMNNMPSVLTRGTNQPIISIIPDNPIMRQRGITNKIGQVANRNGAIVSVSKLRLF